MIYKVELKKGKPYCVVADRFVINEEIKVVIFKDWKDNNVAFFQSDDIKSITKA